RIESNRRAQNRLDKESVAFHERVVEGYQQLISQDPKRFAVINANQSIEQVVTAALQVILQKIDAQ
ncbi:dTMP kinase, partial [Staphylococcus pseudintermedius]